MCQVPIRGERELERAGLGSSASQSDADVQVDGWCGVTRSLVSRLTLSQPSAETASTARQVYAAERAVEECMTLHLQPPCHLGLPRVSARTPFGSSTNVLYLLARL